MVDKNTSNINITNHYSLHHHQKQDKNLQHKGEEMKKKPTDFFLTV